MNILLGSLIAVATAATLLANAWRLVRAGDLPLSLERLGVGLLVVFVWCISIVMEVQAIWWTVLALAALVLVLACVTRQIERAAEHQLIISEGGPMHIRRHSPWLLAATAAAITSLPCLAVLAATVQWSDSLERLAAVTPVAPMSNAAWSVEQTRLTEWLIITVVANVSLPLVAATATGYLQHRRREVALSAWNRNLDAWIATLDNDRQARIVVELDKVRLAHRLGIAVPPDETDAPDARLYDLGA